MNTVTAQNQKGFTLVEIAIVLVIIGLLLGGVLKGQELITNAKIKSVTADIEGITAAYYAYQYRIGRFPGSSGTDSVYNPLFWTDLRREGFISAVPVPTVFSGPSSAPPPVTGPSHDLDGVFSAGNGGMFTSPNKNYLCASNIKSSIARGMDIKFDDGVPDSGVIQAGTTPSAATTTAYTDTAATFVCRAL